jgi:cell division protein FtsQ
MRPLGQPRLAPRRDPAPSRWAYRMQRLWLTPGWWAFLRYGVPVLVLAAMVALVIGPQTHRAAAVAAYDNLKAKFVERPEFLVTHLAIDGAAPELSDAVRVRLGLTLPASSFDLDLPALRLKAEELDAIDAADMMIRPGGVLEVRLTERVPVAVWRADKGLSLIDATGHRVAGLEARADRDDLPLIAGLGADRAVAEALALIDAAGSAAPRLRGLVRMGERRWDMVLDRDQRILLPETDPVAALDGLMALNQSQDILARDLIAIDLRDGQKPVLRLSRSAMTRAQNGTTVAAPSNTTTQEGL